MGWLISAACPTPACPRFAYGPTNRGTALSVLVHCIPPLSRSAHVAGLVILRQTFVGRCHRPLYAHGARNRAAPASSCAGAVLHPSPEGDPCRTRSAVSHSIRTAPCLVVPCA